MIFAMLIGFIVLIFLGVPITFATEGIKNLLMLIPNTRSVIFSVFRMSISRI